MRKKLTILLLLISSFGILFFLAGSFFYPDEKDIKINNDGIDLPFEVVDEIKYTEVPKVEIEESEELIEKSENLKVPEEFFIEVPFTSQAPFALWDEYHEEACEEASLIMLKYFLDGKKLIPQIAESEIQKLIQFQIDKYGDYKDTSAEKTVEIAENFYEMENLKIIYDFQKEDIKNEVFKGNPVIIPAAGRLLGNPYFTPPGPLYHNLVIIGYRGDTIITNDPGTKRGEGYEYDIDVLYNAIHDFPGSKELINTGRKAMIVVDKN